MNRYIIYRCTLHVYLYCLQWDPRPEWDHYNAHSPLAAGNDMEGWYHDPTLPVSPRCLSSCQDVSRCIVYVSVSPPATQLLVAAAEKCEMFEPYSDARQCLSCIARFWWSNISRVSWLILTNLSPPSHHLWSGAFYAHCVVIKYSAHAKLPRYLKIFAMTAAIIKLQPTKTLVLIKIAQHNSD